MKTSNEVPQAPARRASLIYVPLIAILAIALWLRVFGPSMHSFDWGDGQFVHPDEWYLSGLISNISYPHGPLDLFNPDSGWNPAVAASVGDPPVAGHPAHSLTGFNYGSLPLYLTKIFASLLSFLGEHVPPPSWLINHIPAFRWLIEHNVPGFEWLGAHIPDMSMWQNANLILVGRVLSGIFDTITVFLVFLLGKRLADERTGLFAAALACFAVESIQLAHFAMVDCILTTFVTGTLLAAVIMFEQGRTRDYIFVGLWLAAAFATKASSVPLIGAVGLAGIWRQARIHRLLTWETARLTLLLASVTFVAFFIFQPYTFSHAFTDQWDFYNGVKQQGDLASGSVIYFYTIKWHGTTALLYPLSQLTNYSLGIPLALLAYAGLLYEAVRALTPKRHAGAIVAFFVFTYFVFTGVQYVKLLRYMEPIVPALCVLAALLIAALVHNRVWLVSRILRGAGYALGAVVLALTVIYGIAYQHIYSQPLTANQASTWIYAHIPPDSRVAESQPDTSLPEGIDGKDQSLYRWAGNVMQISGIMSTSANPLPLYDDDSLLKVRSMANVLSHAQYYIEPTQRAIASFANYGSKYPYTQRLYKILLGSGLNVPDALGYTLVAQFIEHPQFGPWTDTELGADQNFNEYDHAPVLIFKNTGNLSANAITNVLTENGYIQDPTVGALPLLPQQAILPKSLMLSAKDIATNQHTPAYGAMFAADSLPMRFPIVAWLLMIEALGLLALPIAMRLFGRLGDCGFVLSKTVGILLLAWFAWILASLRIAEYSRTEIALCLLPIAALSLGWGVRLRDIPTLLRPRLRAILLTEGVFLAGFAFFVWLRMIYPDLWHSFDIGEKTMDMSFLNAIVRSRVMPPYDPWFSGGYLNYYYYGHFTVATLLKLVAITPAIAVNLAMPTFFALSISTCVAIAYSLVKRIPFALLAGAMGMLLGNIYGAQVLIGDLQAASPVQGQLRPVASAGSSFPILGGIINLVSFCWALLSGIVQGTYATILGIGQVVLRRSSIQSYPFRSWSWDGSRAIDDHKIITEFPYWTFLYGDPHAHLWDIPFALCIIAVAFNLMHGATGISLRARRGAEYPVTEVEHSPALLPGLSLLIWPLIGILLGAIGPTNTWDFAAMFGILGLTFAARSFWLGAGWPRTIWNVAWRVGTLAVFAFGLYLPFYTHFQSFYSHIGWTILRHQSPIHDFATFFGLPLYILIAYLLYASLSDTNAGLWLRNRLRAALFTMYYWDRRQELPRFFSMVRQPVQRHPSWLPLHRRPLEALVLGLAGVFLAAAFAALGMLPIAGLLLAIVATLILAGPIVTILLVGGGLVLLFLAINYLVLALLTAMASLTILLLIDRLHRQEPAVMFFHVMLIMGLIVASAGEIVYVRDFYDGDPILFRSNTIFKLYEDAWLLLNIAAAVALVRLLVAFLPGMVSGREEHGVLSVAPFGPLPPRPHHANGNGRRPSRTWTRAWIAGLALLLIAAIIYPLRMTPERLDQRATTSPVLAGAHLGPTLDGMLSLKYAYPDDYAAIQWINNTIPGSPVMLQSRYGGYDNFSAGITMFTGLPSVVNWGFEASQQRYNLQDAGNGQIYPEQIGLRERNVVDQIYSTPDPQTALNLLRAYNVSYIYVGLQERGDPRQLTDPNAFHGYPAIGLAKFPLMAIQHQITLVYSHGTVQIYKVPQ
jgi:YYY domain-containing protein